jgi:hypothetical protein
MIIDKEGRVYLYKAGGPTDPREAQREFDVVIKPVLDKLLK